MTRLAPVRVALTILIVTGCAAPSTTPAAVASSTPSTSPIASASPASPSSVPTGSTAPVAGSTPPKLTLGVVVGGLEDPLDIAVRPGHPDDVYIAEQAGRVRLVRSGKLVATQVLDIAGTVTAGGEQGLLGLAFDPDPTDGRFFVYYTALDGSQVLASFRMTAADADVADPASKKILLTMADQYPNHNGGSLAFGPDGYLYIGTGDGGGGGDPLGSGRRLDTLLAKVLRIDVSASGSGGRPYGVPADNPFVATPGALPEIWLTGLRNPWRMRFDRGTGDLWIGDVGQGSWEEIDVARAGVGGLDFGWNLMEGFACYAPAAGTDCARPGLTLPVAAYGHDEGCSVIGGTVYRGDADPALRGWYVFGDYCSGRMWVLDPVGDGRREPVPALDSGRSISAIAEDAAGDLLVTDLARGELLRVGVSGT